MTTGKAWPLLVLAAVFLLIAIRRVGRFRVAMWQAMGGGALAVLAAGSISPRQALWAIDPDIMLFLFGMFTVGEALRESGYLDKLAYHLFRRTRNTRQVTLVILFGGGVLSALLMNDTVAVIGTPLALHLATRHNLSPRVLLLTLAWAVTLGSVMSPIGNPQNLLIALVAGFADPFLFFFRSLAVPTLVNLLLTWLLLPRFFPEEFHDAELTHLRERERDPGLARLCRVSLLLLLALVGGKMVASYLGLDRGFRLTWIALAAAAPVLVASPRRWRILRQIDWHTLAFFAGMFVLMEAVRETGFFQEAIGRLPAGLGSIPLVLAVSVTVSQLISNVPFVALCLPLLRHLGASPSAFMALAAGSTVAGNLLILGAASNVIIIQNAEKRGNTVTFLEFARVGLPLTALNAAIYGLWLGLAGG